MSLFPEVAGLGLLRAGGLVARATFAEAIRLRLTWFIACGGVLLVAAAFWLRDLHFGTSEVRFLYDLGFGALGLSATLVAVLGTAQLFFSDVDSRLVAYVLARPVSRGAWVAGKLAGALAALAFFTGALGLLTAGLLAWRAGDLGLDLPWPAVMRAAAALWLKAAIASAATLLVCTYARSAVFASGAGLLVVLIGHLRPMAAGLPLELSLRGVTGALIRLWPDLTKFDPSIGAAPGLEVVIYGLGYLAVLAWASALAFQLRDL